MKKGCLIVVLGFVGIFVLLIVGIKIWGNLNKGKFDALDNQGIEEGVKFGQSSESVGCFREASLRIAKRANAAPSLDKAMSLRQDLLFLQKCLDQKISILSIV